MLPVTTLTLNGGGVMFLQFGGWKEWYEEAWQVFWLLVRKTRACER